MVKGSTDTDVAHAIPEEALDDIGQKIDVNDGLQF
jgi:hypothetical protein